MGVKFTVLFFCHFPLTCLFNLNQVLSLFLFRQVELFTLVAGDPTLFVSCMDRIVSKFKSLLDNPVKSP